jgi:uncharacterized protein DUF4389
VSYPVHYDVAYAERASRLSTFFRVVLVIPHAIVLALFQIAAAVLVTIAWFVIVIAGRFPAGMFGFVERTLRYLARVNGYMALMTDRFPEFGGGEPGDGYPVELRVDRAERLSRLTTFFRGILIIPAYIVGGALNSLAGILSFFAWFVILITGRLPRGMFDLLLFCHRFVIRLTAYWLLVTDRYPWFQPEEPGPAGPAAGYCASCGQPLRAGDVFCASCGVAVTG